MTEQQKARLAELYAQVNTLGFAAPGAVVAAWWEQNTAEYEALKAAEQQAEDNNASTTSFRVVWEFDVEAGSAVEAARIARETLRGDGGSAAVVFEVTPRSADGTLLRGERVFLDTADADSDACTLPGERA